MSQVLNPQITEAKEKSYSREIEILFSKLKENSKSIKEENKRVERLRRLNDKSFEKLKKAVENLRIY